MITKLYAIEEWERTNNVKATARKFEVYPYQIRQWIKKIKLRILQKYPRGS